MILTGEKIKQAVNDGEIRITPFAPACVNPNSYDLHLGSTLVRYTSGTLDPRSENSFEVLDIPESGFVLQAGELYLGHSVERVGSDHYVPVLHAKSGIARLGLFVHITADLIDIGSHGNLTFQLHPTLSLRVYPGMRIGQVSFWKPEGEVLLYSGKYQGSRGPMPSLSYKDYVVE
jgi:dCTP deaminase